MLARRRRQCRSGSGSRTRLCFLRLELGLLGPLARCDPASLCGIDSGLSGRVFFFTLLLVLGFLFRGGALEDLLSLFGARV